jgi:hypothetical protein
MAGALTERMAFGGAVFDRLDSMIGAGFAAEAAGGRLGTMAFGGSGIGSAGLAGSAE